jgi:hypothetical protein
VNVVRRLAVQPDHLGLTEIGVLHHEREIGAEFPSITGGKPYDLRRGQVTRIQGGQRVFDPDPQLLRADFRRVVLHAQRAVRGDHFQEAGNPRRVQRERQRPHLVIDAHVHLRTELHHQSTIAGCKIPNRH